MRIFCFSFFFLLSGCTFAQTKLPYYSGVRHVKTLFRGDSVDVLIFSKESDSLIAKPLLIFCQGSLPQPLIKLTDDRPYGVFPFDPAIFTDTYHLVIIGKPGIPLAVHVKNLNPNFTYTDANGSLPKAYTENNHPSYYLSRNLSVLKYLSRFKWVDKSRLIVAGHSEGSYIATLIASKHKRATRLIYAAGNPAGRILSIIARDRKRESDTDSTRSGEDALNYWQQVTDNKNSRSTETGDPFYTTYSFSEPQSPLLMNLKIPTLVVYGTKDDAAPYIDQLRVHAIRSRNRFLLFKPYINCDHNFFPVLENGSPDHSQFNWNLVARHWQKWLLDAPAR